MALLNGHMSASLEKEYEGIAIYIVLCWRALTTSIVALMYQILLSNTPGS